MLVPCHTNKSCRNSFIESGECCCNCIHRHLLLVNGFPVGFVCYINMDGEQILIRLNRSGHGMCEMHCSERDRNKNINDLNILTDE